MKRQSQHQGKKVESTPQGDTRMRLLNAARDVFVESGYHNATVREICARAGVNVAAINYHFGDKTELYTEVLRQSFPFLEMESIQNPHDRDAPPEDLLKQEIRLIVHAFVGTRGSSAQIQIAARELVQPSPALSRVLGTVTQPLYDRLNAPVSRIIGLDRDHVTTRLCTHSISGQIVYFASHQTSVFTQLWPELEITSEQIDRISDHISAFSLAYLRKARTGDKKSSSKRKGE